VKKILNILTPMGSSIVSILAVVAFFRVYLFIYTQHVIKDFQKQNYSEIYSGDTFKIISRLNAFSNSYNVVCISGNIQNKNFYNLKNGECSNSLLQQNVKISISYANNILLKFTLKFPVQVEFLFFFFLICQALVLAIIIRATRYSEEDKRKNESRVNKLARQMSHDIRSPLATLNTVVEDMKNIDEESKALLRKSISRINEISNNLLEKSSGNNIEISVPRIDQVEILSFLADILDQKRIEYKNVKIEINDMLNEYNVLTKVDKVEFNRVISNLINNSYESSSTEIILTVELHNKEKIKISLNDNGIGIPASVIELLGKNEFTTKKTGNGLGIMHAVSSVKSWGGEFLIKSQKQGGAVVEIILPRVVVQPSSIYENLTILLDNDELVRITWQFKAKKMTQNFLSFETFDELKKIIHLIPKNTDFYIDSDLGNSVKGEEIALNLHKNGFTQISMASGNNNEYFKNLTFLKCVKDKTPPWS
jgi:signal transduction histidine kinase